MSDGDGRVFLITGASSGIGEATARRAEAAGFRVVLAARSTDTLEGAGKGTRQPRRHLRCHRVEAARGDGRAHSAEYGRIDVAFANAGFGLGRSFKSETSERWREMVLTNVQPPHVDVNEILVRGTAQES